MPLTPSQVAVASTPTQLVAALHDPTANNSRAVTVLNTGDATVYIGGSTVSTGTGFPLAAGASYSDDLSYDDELYAIAASSGAVSVMVNG